MITAKTMKSTVKLHNGVEMPWIGLGVWQMTEEKIARQAIEEAIELGYRSLDTAAFYENEEFVGASVRESALKRNELFVTTKVWNDDQGYDSTLRAFEKSMNKLQIDYVDLYLIHWPVASKFSDTWRAIEKLYREKSIRAIGVSNFHIDHLETLAKTSEIKPMVNQVEYHPQLVQKELRTYCKEQSIQLEAWSPLAHGELLNNNLLKQIGDKYGKTPAQVILRWDLETGVVTIPKTVDKHHLKQNIEIFDFELSHDDHQMIARLNTGERIGADPDNFDF